LISTEMTLTGNAGRLRKELSEFTAAVAAAILLFCNAHAGDENTLVVYQTAMGSAQRLANMGERAFDSADDDTRPDRFGFIYTAPIRMRARWGRQRLSE
jgi:hypothetical protein